VDAKLYVWDIELDAVQFFNFQSGRDEGEEYMARSSSGLSTSEGEKDITVAERLSFITFLYLCCGTFS